VHAHVPDVHVFPPRRTETIDLTGASAARKVAPLDGTPTRLPRSRTPGVGLPPREAAKMSFEAMNGVMARRARMGGISPKEELEAFDASWAATEATWRQPPTISQVVEAEAEARFQGWRAAAPARDQARRTALDQKGGGASGLGAL